MNIMKRDGSTMTYQADKIIRAVMGAMRDVGNVDADLAVLIENEVFSNLNDDITVEEISDEIESVLIDMKQKEIVRAFMRYRQNRDKAREHDVKYKFFTKSFLSKYKHTPTPMTELGNFVYYRTYSRWLDMEQRREQWWETVARAVDYNCSLAPTTIKEAETLYDNIFNLKQFLSGRTLWVGGTDVAKLYPSSNFNCATKVIDSFDAYKDMFYLLMVGSGVGFRVLKEDVAKLPPVRGNINVHHEAYQPLPKVQRKEYTQLEILTGGVAVIHIGDSKEGWTQALDFFLKIHYSHDYRKITSVMVNYDSVRPNGERLKMFGGTASGHESMLNMLRKVSKILANDSTKKLKTIEAMDIANIIAENVVVGGVRRSAQICMCDADDTEVINAKSNLYKQIDGKWEIDRELSHRQMSNNSIYYFDKPSREQLHWQIEQQRYSGEPGFYNAAAGLRRRSDFVGTNPCGEILLQNNGMCNLTTVNVFAFVKDGVLDTDALEVAFKLSARAGYRMALVELELPNWAAVMREDRLIGCSFTGWQDMMNAIGINKQSEAELWTWLRHVANTAAEEYAKEIGENVPKLVTTIKPEGTLSQLPTVSSGIHYSHSPYYVRRVRINAADPLVKVCEELEYPIFPEVGQDWETCKVKVIEFPVKAPEGKTKYDVSALEQLENYQRSMKYYVDHNCSITVHVRDNEWDMVEQWIWDNWNEVLGISFLSLDDSMYNLLPYEAITEEEYNERKSKMKTFNSALLLKYETGEEFELDDDPSCGTGACPTR